MSNLQKFNQTIADNRTQDYLQKVLGERKNSFVNNITAIVSSNVNLQECEPISLIYAGIKATALDLPLDQNLGFAYVLPYKNTKLNKTDAQFQLGYKGFKQLAIRTGMYKHINSGDVRQGEIEKFDYLTGEIVFNFVQNQDERNKLEIVGFFSYIELTNGYRSTLYMSKKEIEAHGKRFSQTYKKGFGMWVDDFNSMALKTVTKLNLSKNGVLSVELKEAQRFDQAIIVKNEATEELEPVFIDNSATSKIEEIAETSEPAQANSSKLNL
ncbi:MAG TPA: recombinase RecT [Paludibacteraceae bacterium]|jgi:recombination protein RecT|nr:recombinase RecT [Paludibacteraceae bacterium]